MAYQDLRKIKPRYQKIGLVVYGMPFKDGSYGVRVVRDSVRIYHVDNVIRTRRLSAKEKVQAVA